ncbi:hypothetical protein HZB00_01020 [Candidatus Woesearchaeota archaeon]|nr:hypothetical protein [Candidatus Woesearchaeota archaeon]
MANRPIKKYRAGAIEVCIWDNEKQIGDALVGFKTISLSRSFKKKGEDIWRSEQLNLRKSDLPKVLVTLNEAMKEILLSHPEEEREEDE